MLGRYAPDERVIADAMTARAADAIIGWLREGVTAACSVNRPPGSASAPAPAEGATKRNTPADPGRGA